MKLLVCAGEASGDVYAARILDEIRARAGGEVECRGIGGAQLAVRGAVLSARVEDLAVMGFIPVLAKLPFFLRVMRDMKRLVAEWKPHAVVTVDYPGFNLRLAKFARSLGVPVVHVVCPQVWAWHKGRIPEIAASLDRLLCFFPFEPALFPPAPGFEAKFIGHPLADFFREEKPRDMGVWRDGARRVALLPGSRRGEISRCLPRLLAAARILEDSLAPQPVSFAVPAASPRTRAMIEKTIGAAPPDRRPRLLSVTDGGARDILRTSEVAAVASGTATLEAALARCPTVLVYATSFLFALFVYFFVRGVKHVGLANIVAGREIMPELLQYRFTPKAVADILAGWLRNPESRADAAARLDETVRTLESGDGGALGRAAEEILVLAGARRKEQA